jgi:hypothetical protein
MNALEAMGWVFEIYLPSFFHVPLPSKPHAMGRRAGIKLYHADFVAIKFSSPKKDTAGFC